MTTHLSLILPDGTELSYGDVPDGFAPGVGELIAFDRSDPYEKLEPDEHGLEEGTWLVLERAWGLRTREGLDPHRIAFVTLGLGRP